MTIGIYRIFHVESGKSYIGQSKDVEARLCNHFWHLQKETHRNCHLQRAYSLYGADAFKSEILQVCTQELLTQQEQFWMDFYRLEGLYNSAPAAGSTAGFKFSLSDEQRQRISEAQKGKKRQVSEETCWRISEAKKGKTLSEEHRQRISEGNKVRWARYRAEKEATQ